MGERAASEIWWAAALLIGCALAFLAFRILGSADTPTIDLRNIDLFTAHYPMTRYGFGALAEGRFPLWNPYQLCGQPFLATYYPGLLYPPNLVYLPLPVPLATELDVIFHSLLAGAGMWWLARRLSIGPVGAFAAALTFMWSGWMVTMMNQPTGIGAESWMPLTAVLMDRVVQGERRAWLWLVLAVSCQLLVGAAEIFTHVMYAGGILAATRLLQLGRDVGWPSTARRGLLLLLCIVGGVALSSVQLLPTFELVLRSARAPETLRYGQAIFQGDRFPPREFLNGSLEFHRWLTVGALPLFFWALAPGDRIRRHAWLLGAICAAVGALLVFGGLFYRLYFETPIGGLFRGPRKFLDVYAFGQALLLGVALTRLDAWRALPTAHLWRRPAWLAGLAAGGGLLLWMAAEGRWNPYVVAALILLVGFGVLPGARPRALALAGLVAIQIGSLWAADPNRHLRPVQRKPEHLAASPVLHRLGAGPGGPRVYLSPSLSVVRGFWPKHGMLASVPVSVDYEPLSVGRYAGYFARASGSGGARRLFNGRYELGPEAAWRLMDLTGTRYYVMTAGDSVVDRMDREPGFALWATTGPGGRVRVYERRRAMPRAWFVPHAVGLPDESAVMQRLLDPRFDPRRTVLLEDATREELASTVDSAHEGQVRIGSYTPEEVVLEVEATGPGWLVLSDLFYPGWYATVDEHPVEIQRANYLFRAVKVEGGRSSVRFQYRPRSLGFGLAMTLATAVTIIVVAFAASRRRSHS